MKPCPSPATRKTEFCMFLHQQHAEVCRVSADISAVDLPPVILGRQNKKGDLKHSFDSNPCDQLISHFESSRYCPVSMDGWETELEIWKIQMCMCGQTSEAFFLILSCESGFSVSFDHTFVCLLVSKTHVNYNLLDKTSIRHKLSHHSCYLTVTFM